MTDGGQHTCGNVSVDRVHGLSLGTKIRIGRVTSEFHRALHALNLGAFRRHLVLDAGEVVTRHLAATAAQGLLGLQAAAIAGRIQQLDEFFIAGLGEVWQRLRGEVIGLDADDVADIRPFPVEGRTFPTGGEKPAHGVYIAVGRARHFDEGHRLLFLLKGRAFRGDRVLVNRAGTPVGSEGGVVPLGRVAGLIHVNRAAAGAAAVVGQRCDALIGEIFVEPWVAMVAHAGEVVEAHVPAAAIIGVVSREEVHLRTDGDFEDVTGAGGVNFQAAAVRAHTNHSAATMLQGAAIRALGLHEAEVATRDVEPAIHAQAKAIRGVVGGTVGVSEGDVLDQDVLLLGNTIAIGVGEFTEMRRVH